MCRARWPRLLNPADSRILSTSGSRTLRPTRGPRRRDGTLGPPGTAARSCYGRRVCGPARPWDEVPPQSGQRAPAPRSTFLCGEGGGLCTPLWTRPFGLVHGSVKRIPCPRACPVRTTVGPWSRRGYARWCALHERPRRQHTALDESDLEWLHLLVSEWQLLSDLSFADLVLWVPTRDGTRYVSVAQMRPNTGPTSYQDDMVGHLVPRGRRPLLDAALDEGRIVREGDPEWREEVPVRVESIPVRREGRVLGVIARNTNLLTVRTPSRLELTYLQCASDLAQMIAAGSLPVPRRAGRHGRLAARRRRADPARRRRRRPVRQPQRAVRVPPVGTRRPTWSGTTSARTTAELAPARGPVDEALVKLASGWAPRESEVEGERRRHPAARHPAQAQGRPGSVRWCCSATSPNSAAASAS